MRVIGLDPGLRRTGWGIIEQHGNRLTHIANGTLVSSGSLSLAERLVGFELPGTGPGRIVRGCGCRRDTTVRRPLYAELNVSTFLVRRRGRS